MALQTIADGNATYAPAKYVRYTMPEDGVITDKMLHLKPNEHVDGYFLKTLERELKGKIRLNHILVQKDGLHIVIPDNKEVTKAFQSDAITVGALTRFTYLGKKQFQTKSGETARSVKCLLQQDKEDVVTFEGTPGSEQIVGTKPMATPAPTAQPQTAEVTASDVPF